GGAKRADARGVALELAGATARDLHRRAQVGDRLRKHFLAFFCEAVADGEQRVAARGEIRPPVLEGAAPTRLPSAAMRGNERGKGSRPDGQIKVAGERHAVMGGVGEAGVRFDGW